MILLPMISRSSPRLVINCTCFSSIPALQSLDLGDGHVQQWRMEDVPFAPNADEVLALPSATALKKLPAHTFRVRLVAVDGARERPLGEYTFAHTPS